MYSFQRVIRSSSPGSYPCSMPISSSIQGMEHCTVVLYYVCTIISRILQYTINYIIQYYILYYILTLYYTTYLIPTITLLHYSHMMVPHRLMPYSNRVIAEAHHRDIQSIHDGAWAGQSCCMPRQNCQERKTWVPIANSTVPIINYYGLYVPLGNVNFLAESFRACTMSDYLGDKGYCP